MARTVELSEQTPLSGFDRKQKQVEAGEISDVGASIDRVGQGRQSDAAAVNYGAAVGWEGSRAESPKRVLRLTLLIEARVAHPRLHSRDSLRQAGAQFVLVQQLQVPPLTNGRRK